MGFDKACDAFQLFFRINSFIVLFLCWEYLCSISEFQVVIFFLEYYTGTNLSFLVAFRIIQNHVGIFLIDLLKFLVLKRIFNAKTL